MTARNGGANNDDIKEIEAIKARVAEAQLRTQIDRLVRLDRVHRQRILQRMTDPEIRTIEELWWLWAHAGQFAPPGDWRIWLIRAGRGFGKTRAGAEWISDVARGNPAARIALVGATEEDVRRVMIEGEAGLLNVARCGENTRYHRTTGEVVFHSGAVAAVFTAAAPEKLRGPEHHAAWCDELAKWRYGDAAWDNLMLGMRGGNDARTLVTTTPRNIALMHKVMTAPGLVETRGASRDNPHLPASFLAAMEEHYGGTRLALQELEGELLVDVVGALWSRAMLDACRVAACPEIVRTVVAVDPPAGGEDGDACGIVAVALGRDERGYVLEDASVAGLSPEGWARAVAMCAARHKADRVIAEKNQGGTMVASVLLAADAGLPLALVHASTGKVARAEPVATLRGAERAIAAARGAIGVRFRLHGRDPAFGLDCVGLAGVAMRSAGFAGEIPASYALRGGDAATIAARLDASGLARREAPAPGDLALFGTGPRQFHLALLVEDGIVHADAMLRRVVERPGVPPWPMLGCWHVKEE